VFEVSADFFLEINVFVGQALLCGRQLSEGLLELPLAHDTLGDVLTGADSPEEPAVRAGLRDRSAVQPVAGRAIGSEHPVGEPPIVSARLDEFIELIHNAISILRM
jgi:hypothetical protein